MIHNRIIQMLYKMPISDPHSKFLGIGPKVIDEVVKTSGARVMVLL